MHLSENAKNIKPSSTLALNTRVKKMIKEGSDIINFTIGEPDFDTPENIKAAAIRSVNEGFTKYTPAEGTEELRDAISKKLLDDNGLNYTSTEIIVSSGAKHSIYTALQAILNAGNEVIIPAPYWVSYLQQVKLCGGVPVVADTVNFTLDVNNIRKKMTHMTKAVIVNTPNNPTGAVYDESILKELAELCIERDIIIISDEIYEKFVYDRKHCSIAKFAKDNIIVINGVSKAYSMTGWRIGYSAGPEEIISAMAGIQSQTTANPCSISQKAALEALTGSQKSVAAMLAEFRKRRDFVLKRLEEISIPVTKPEGAFYLFPEIGGESPKFASKLLDEAKVAVVPGIEFGSDKHFRISYALSMQNLEKGLERIKSFMKFWGNS